ncbi:hypothetical protein EJ08DRAFT_662075 [Tothia fuscella]|uniref:Uncharacterized protein n=1 Tax=Tothia fuscella TaxID=1048955 RepID=A0A9P4NP84_9PEZI|nr:hypothetical protein EJ08DRAFT_662075 [Tothia fuscella]
MDYNERQQQLHDCIYFPLTQEERDDLDAELAGCFAARKCRQRYYDRDAAEAQHRRNETPEQKLRRVQQRNKHMEKEAQRLAEVAYSKERERQGQRDQAAFKAKRQAEWAAAVMESDAKVQQMERDIAQRRVQEEESLRCTNRIKAFKVKYGDRADEVSRAMNNGWKTDPRPTAEIMDEMDRKQAAYAARLAAGEAPSRTVEDFVAALQDIEDLPYHWGLKPNRLDADFKGGQIDQAPAVEPAARATAKPRRPRPAKTANTGTFPNIPPVAGFAGANNHRMLIVAPVLTTSIVHQPRATAPGTNTVHHQQAQNSPPRALALPLTQSVNSTTTSRVQTAPTTKSSQPVIPPLDLTGVPKEAHKYSYLQWMMRNNTLNGIDILFPNPDGTRTSPPPMRENFRLFPRDQIKLQFPDLYDPTTGGPVVSKLDGSTIKYIKGVPILLSKNMTDQDLDNYRQRGAHGIISDILPRISDFEKIYIPDTRDLDVRKIANQIASQLNNKQQKHREEVRGGLLPGFRINSSRFRIFVQRPGSNPSTITVQNVLCAAQLFFNTRLEIDWDLMVMKEPATGFMWPCFTPEDIPSPVRADIEARTGIPLQTYAAFFARFPHLKDYKEERHPLYWRRMREEQQHALADDMLAFRGTRPGGTVAPGGQAQGAGHVYAGSQVQASDKRKAGNSDQEEQSVAKRTQMAAPALDYHTPILAPGRVPQTQHAPSTTRNEVGGVKTSNDTESS